MSASSSIRPAAGESYRGFVVRAHGQLMQAIPDPDERNQAVWKAWYSVHGDPLADRAQEIFPESEYRTVPNVCYFLEHTTTSKTKTGEPQIVKYGVKELGDIVDEHNERADTDNYTAMTNGHTISGAHVPDNLKPRVVGYAGPYRLGMVGRSKPIFAVFADEHHIKAELPTLERKKRRSVEINRFLDGRRPFIDPVAVLGSEAPRLALPIARYQLEDEDDGRIVERYMAPVGVSGGNTFLLEPVKERHSLEQRNVVDEATVKAVVEAIFSSSQFQFLNQLMQSSQQGGGQPGQPGAAPGGMPGGATPPQNPSSQFPPSQPQASPQQGPSQGPPSFGDDGDDDDMGGGNGDPNMANRQRYQLTDGDEFVSVERFSALHDEHAELVERYSALEAAYKDSLRDQAHTREAVIQLEKRAVDAERTQRITDLYSQFPHFIDIDEEKEVCLYSHGSDMGAEAFEKHMARTEKMARKSSPVTQMVPGGSMQNQNDGGMVEKYSADFVDRVVERQAYLASTGQLKGRKFDDIAAELLSDK